MSATTLEPTTTTDSTTANEPPKSTVDATGTNGASGQTDGEKRFTQAELNAILAEERRKADDKAKRDREKAEREAEEKRLAESQEYRTLWEKSTERVRELEAQVSDVETLSKRAERAEQAVAELVKAELEGAPDYIVDAIRDRDPVGKLDFIRKHRDQWASGSRDRRGDSPLPRTGNVTLSRDELIRQEIEAQRRRGR